MDSEKISLLDLLVVLGRRKWLILGITFAAGVAAALVSLLMPPLFTATAVIMPPQQAQSSLSMLAGALNGMSGLGGLGASSLGLKNPADVYIGILESRTIGDALITRFDLKTVYQDQLLSETRKHLAKYTATETGKGNLIRISVQDRDPKRAADIANAYVDELFKQNSRLALTESAQRRLFFEQEVAKEKEALAQSEAALKATQQSTGLVVPAGQAEALIRSAAQLRAQVTSREVELQALRSYATEQNPNVQILEREIGALRQQLAQLEAKGGSSDRLNLAGGNLPAASLEYVRRLRDVKYHETLFELLAKQYEAARLDEAKSVPVIQVVDPAVVPDRRSWPPRTALTLAAAVAAALLSSAYVLLRARATAQ